MVKKTLIYQLWPLSWGSIKTMTTFLPRIAALGADYVWISPVYESPFYNDGYDVSDYYKIDGRFGNMTDMDEFIKTAHSLGLKVIMDLIIDSTSVEHSWFLQEEEYRYFWSKDCLPERRSILDESNAWVPYKDTNCLCSNHPKQVNLNWFNGGVLNRALMESFKSIMHFWLHDHDIDGFRIAPQLINQDVAEGDIKFADSLMGARALQVVNGLSNLYVGKIPFLIMDLMDPKFGEVTKYYADKTDIEFVTNRMLKSAIAPKGNLKGLKKKISRQVKCSKFMLNLESHDSARFTSRSGLNGKEVMDLLFQPEVQAVCLYQGQELGLENPSEEQLSVAQILNMDPKAAAFAEKQRISPESLRQNSRANSRLPLPLDEYSRQEKDEDSVLNYAKTLVKRWRE